MPLTSDDVILNIVLVHPEIPQNTGTIGRQCVCTNSRLHLIAPFSFDLDEKKLRRAGLDYWPHLDLKIHQGWEAFLEKEHPSRLFFSSTKTSQIIYDYSFTKGDYLVFGNETSGLPKPFYEQYQADLYKIPMLGEFARSFNLANSVSVVMFEAIRQIGRWHHWNG